MAYKTRQFDLPRPRFADWQPPAEQSAWALREQIVKQEVAERAAIAAASAARKAAAEAAQAKAADNAINSSSSAVPARHGVSEHFD
jgi:hypothetical protein